MPAGLDGNPDPIVTAARRSVVETVADEVSARKVRGRPLLVAIDGMDGSGKSTFADELGSVLQGRGAVVVRSTIDSFHNSRAIRLARGRASPVGFYLDSHDLDRVVSDLLEPLSVGSGTYVTAIFDAPSDKAVTVNPIAVGGDEILLFDGIFACRPELARFWHFAIFLDGQQRVNLTRLGHVMAELPTTPTDVVAHVLDWQARIDRYSSGMRYYLDLVNPAEAADMVIDNNDLAQPFIVERT